MKKSNIEILRIIAFIMVLVIHITSVGLVENLIIQYSISWYYAVIMRIIAAPAVCIFILISGYLMGIKNDSKTKMPLKRLLLPLAFYSPILVVSDYLVTNSLLKTLLNMIQFTGYFYHLWYVLIYIVIVFIIHNMKPCIKLDKNMFLKVVITLLSIITISSTILHLFHFNLFYNYFANNVLLYMFLLYILGLIIGRYDLKIKKIYLILVYTFSIIISFFIYFFVDSAGISFITATSQIFNCLSAVSLFLIFKDINIKSNNFVNSIGQSTFGAYIIHVFYISYLQRFFPFLMHAKDSNYYLYDVLFILFVAICSLLTEYIRQLILKYVTSLKNKKESFMPKVSIIIPVYNGEKYVKKAIKSALHQTYKNIEIIVINDGSTDKTDKICQSFGNKIKYYQKKNGGVSTALNLGIEKMTGEYFSWLSHDDIYKRNKISEQIKYIGKLNKKEIVIYSDYAFITANGRKFGNNVVINHEEVSKHYEISLLKGYINGITLLIPRTAFEKYGDFDENLFCTQDYDKWLELIKYYEFIHLPKVLGYTRLHDEQTTNKSDKVIKEGNELWLKIINAFNDEKKKEIYGSVKNYYKELAIFLSKTSYNEAYEYCQKRMR